MKRLRLPLDDMQWAIAKGILKEADIPFSTPNEQFLSLFPGGAVGAFERELRVADEDYEQAYELLHDFFNE